LYGKSYRQQIVWGIVWGIIWEIVGVDGPLEAKNGTEPKCHNEGNIIPRPLVVDSWSQTVKDRDDHEDEETSDGFAKENKWVSLPKDS
jgi:hypothetical protein